MLRMQCSSGAFYASWYYDQNMDFMIAQYYPSYSEMAARRLLTEIVHTGD